MYMLGLRAERLAKAALTKKTALTELIPNTLATL